MKRLTYRLYITKHENSHVKHFIKPKKQKQYLQKLTIFYNIKIQYEKYKIQYKTWEFYICGWIVGISDMDDNVCWGWEGGVSTVHYNHPHCVLLDTLVVKGSTDELRNEEILIFSRETFQSRILLLLHRKGWQLMVSETKDSQSCMVYRQMFILYYILKKINTSAIFSMIKTMIHGTLPSFFTKLFTREASLIYLQLALFDSQQTSFPLDQQVKTWESGLVCWHCQGPLLSTSPPLCREGCLLVSTK